MLSKQDIIELYDKFVKVNDTRAYKDKYVPLPMELNNQIWKWKNKDFPRVMALLEFRQYMLKYGRTFNAVLSFNSINIWGEKDPEFAYLKFKDAYDFNYDDDIKYDLHCLELERTDFDFVMLNQVIEHLYDPILALKNVYKHMSVGGLFYANVPVTNSPHDTPFHFYMGVTPVGLGVMTKLAGFDILKIGQWGNQEYLRKSNVDLWPDYRYGKNPGRNEMKCPVITWCLSMKTHEKS